jgi:hypothetical protein
MRYGANGLPLVEKKNPEAPKQPAPQPVVQPAPQPVVHPVNVVHNDVEEGNVPANNE